MTDLSRILISRPDRIGDVVITTACLPLLKQKFPNATIAVMANSVAAPLFYKHPFVDAFIALDGAAGPGDEIKQFAADVSVHCNPDLTAARLCQEASIPLRIGYEEDRSFLTKSFPNDKRKGVKHEAEYVFDLLAPLGVSCPDSPLEASIVAAALPAQVALPEAFFVFHLGSHGKKARIPERVFSDTAQWLWDKYSVHSVLIGGDAELGLNEGFCEQLKDPPWISDLCGKLNLAELLMLMKEAKGFIGRDSGPAHLAAASGAHTFCYMPASRPDISLARWKPLGSHVTVMAPQGKARWWENTEKANARILNGIDSSKLKDLLTPLMTD